MQFIALNQNALNHSWRIKLNQFVVNSEIWWIVWIDSYRTIVKCMFVCVSESSRWTGHAIRRSLSSICSSGWRRRRGAVSLQHQHSDGERTQLVQPLQHGRREPQCYRGGKECSVLLQDQRELHHRDFQTGNGGVFFWAVKFTVFCLFSLFFVFLSWVNIWTQHICRFK